MSALSYEVEPELEASEPPEARGLRRDDVRLMIATLSSGEIVHTRFSQMPSHLTPGDLLLINTSATLPAAVPASTDAGDHIEVRFATRAPQPASVDELVVELRGAGGEAPVAAGHAGDTIRLAGGASLKLAAAYRGSDRLWLARLRAPEPLYHYLTHHGRPIRYGYVNDRWPLSTYQNSYATARGSAEMPSAGRPFTPTLITRLVATGVLFAPLLLHTGVSSPERHEPPYPEQYDVPPATARLVNAVRAWGRRVIAVGTTAVRALETVAERDGTVRPGSGWTDLIVSPDRGLWAVDGLLTGWHEPQASHLQILTALTGEAFIQQCYTSAVQHRYLWHEFGDSHLILP